MMEKDNFLFETEEELEQALKEMVDLGVLKIKIEKNGEVLFGLTNEGEELAEKIGLELTNEEKEILKERAEKLKLIKHLVEIDVLLETDETWCVSKSFKNKIDYFFKNVEQDIESAILLAIVDTEELETEEEIISRAMIIGEFLD